MSASMSFTCMLLLLFSDISTAAVAKDALKGHCIYDGDYCLQSGVFAMQQASGLCLLQQWFGRILWLFHCFLGVSMLVMVLCSLKVILDKLPLGIQPCRQADHLFFRVPAHFLVNHMDPALFQRMPQRPLLLGHTTQINPSAPSVKRSSVCTLLKCAIW